MSFVALKIKLTTVSNCILLHFRNACHDHEDVATVGGGTVD